MIASLRGQVLESDGSSVVVDVQGVGYQVFCTQTCLSTFDVGDSVQVTIFTEFKQDSLKLYGFADKLEKQVFILLTLVKGIGPKSALDIVSRIPARELLRLIGSGDLHTLQSVKGIGKKTAERVIVELKDKVGEYALEQQSVSSTRPDIHEPLHDAISALQALGFTKRDAERAVSEIQKTGVPLTDSGVIVREALRYI